MQNHLSEQIAGFFTAYFAPTRAEALASEIRQMARKLGAGRFRATLHAIANDYRLIDAGLDERTLMLVVERMFDPAGNRDRAPGRRFAAYMNDVLACLPPDELQSTLDDVCRRLKDAARQPHYSGFPRPSRKHARP